MFKVADGILGIAVGSAGKSIDGCVTMFGPGVDGDVALGEESNSCHALGLKLVGGDTEECGARSFGCFLK